MANLKVAHINLTKFKSHASEEKPDLLAVEEPLEIRIVYGEEYHRKEINLSVTMRTPGNDFELALGFLFSEGVIRDFHDIISIHYCQSVKKPEELGNVLKVEIKAQSTFDISSLERNFYTNSACGVCGKSSIDKVLDKKNISYTLPNIQVNPQILVELPKKLSQEQSVFAHTGGLHASALFPTSGDLFLIREDIGRHNALDKVIGACLHEKLIPLSEYILLLSGRISYELVQKAIMAGIQVIAAVGAPSSLAVSLAKESSITLIGFLREHSFNVYTGKERVLEYKTTDSQFFNQVELNQ